MRRARFVAIVTLLVLSVPVAGASAPGPLAALDAYWADIAAGSYAAAYQLLMPGSIGVTSAQFIATERGYHIEQAHFRGSVAASTPSTATIDVSQLLTIDRQYGCRTWTGTYEMAKQDARWFIARSNITPHACVAATSGRPILAGPWGPHQNGYGQVAPTTIFNGGDPTGLVTHIHWNSWGGPRATGTGTAEWVGPHQDVAQGHAALATVVAFHLGTCHGRRAYDALEWYFPTHGQSFSAGDYIDPCSGTYYMRGRPG
jgi:hypothetical protein